jgi:hypothetical protein
VGGAIAVAQATTDPSAVQATTPSAPRSTRSLTQKLLQVLGAPVLAGVVHRLGRFQQRGHRADIVRGERSREKAVGQYGERGHGHGG